MSPSGPSTSRAVASSLRHGGSVGSSAKKTRAPGPLTCVAVGVRLGAAPSEIFFCRSMIVISRSFTWEGKQRGMAWGSRQRGEGMIVISRSFTSSVPIPNPMP